MRSLFKTKSRPYIGGHKGTAVYYPENTMVAFEKSLALGADYIELDVQLSKDDIPVVIHNDTVDATTNGKGRVRDFTVDELKQLDAGSWFGEAFAGVKIPTLEEILIWAKGKTWVSIEIKPGPEYCDLIEKKIVEVIERTNMIEYVHVMSADHKALKRIKDRNQDIMISIAHNANLYDPIGTAKQVNADIINVPWFFLTEEMINEMHDNGLLVHGSLNNDPEVWKEMQKRGIDMVDTDVPDILKKATKK